MTTKTSQIALAVSLVLAGSAVAQTTFQGPSMGSPPYVLPLLSGTETYSVFTTDNTGANPDDTVQNLVGRAPSGMAGIPDGMGAFDNGDGTFTLLMNHKAPLFCCVLQELMLCQLLLAGKDHDCRRVSKSGAVCPAFVRHALLTTAAHFPR